MLEKESSKEIILRELDKDLLDLENIVKILSNEVERLEVCNKNKKDILEFLIKMENGIW